MGSWQTTIRFNYPSPQQFSRIWINMNNSVLYFICSAVGSAIVKFSGVLLKYILYWYIYILWLSATEHSISLFHPSSSQQHVAANTHFHLSGGELWLRESFPPAPFRAVKEFKYKRLDDGEEALVPGLKSVGSTITMRTKSDKMSPEASLPVAWRILPNPIQMYITHGQGRPAQDSHLVQPTRGK